MEKDGEKYRTEVNGCTLAAALDGRKIGLFPDTTTERGVKPSQRTCGGVEGRILLFYIIRDSDERDSTGPSQ